MRHLRDPFISRLLVALALYAAFVISWTHTAPALAAGPRAQAAAGSK